MANIHMEKLQIPGETDVYSFIPVAATETERGGIFAALTSDDDEYSQEVKVKSNGKAYVGHDSTKLDNKLSSDDADKFMKVDSDGNVVPVTVSVGFETVYEASTRTLLFVNPGMGDVSVDSTLLTSGKAADSKVTGQRITELESQITELRELFNSIVDADTQLY